MEHYKYQLMFFADGFLERPVILTTLPLIKIAVQLIDARIALEMPCLRLAIILGAVIMLNLFSLAWLQNRKIHEYYRSEEQR